MTRALTLTAALLLQGCCLSPGFVPAQRAFFEAIKPEYKSYVQADVTLSEEDKAMRMDLLDAQEAVLREAEAE